MHPIIFLNCCILRKHVNVVLNSILMMSCDEPLEQILGKCVLREVPVSINGRRHFHCVFSWEDSTLNYTPCIDQDLPSQGVYVKCISEMRFQKLVYRVKHAQLSICRDYEWLHDRVCVQPEFKNANMFSYIMHIIVIHHHTSYIIIIPVAYELMIARIIYCNISFR